MRTFIFGAGAVAKETAWLINDSLSQGRNTKSIVAFVTKKRGAYPDRLFESVPIITESEFFSYNFNDKVSIILAVGNPSVKWEIASRIKSRIGECCEYPCLIHPRAVMDLRPNRVRLGEGVTIYPGVVLSTDVTIGDFVHVNPCAGVGHDVSIGSYCTVCPGAIISGNVTIGIRCFIGAGAVVRDGVSIPDGCIIGAGAVVTDNIEETGVWVGTPARRIDG